MALRNLLGTPRFLTGLSVDRNLRRALTSVVLSLLITYLFMVVHIGTELKQDARFLCCKYEPLLGILGVQTPGL